MLSARGIFRDQPDRSFRELPDFPRSVIVRISEARNLGDANQYTFYESMKIYCARRRHSDLQRSI